MSDHKPNSDGYDVARLDTISDADERELAKIGKKSVLRVSSLQPLATPPAF